LSDLADARVLFRTVRPFQPDGPNWDGCNPQIRRAREGANCFLTIFDAAEGGRSPVIDWQEFVVMGRAAACHRSGFKRESFARESFPSDKIPKKGWKMP